MDQPEPHGYYSKDDVKLCKTSDSINQFRLDYDLQQKAFKDPRLVILNAEKLAILSNEGIHDLMSTSSLTLTILSLYFGPLYKWSKPTEHTYFQIEDKSPNVLFSKKMHKSGIVNFNQNNEFFTTQNTIFPKTLNFNITQMEILRSGSSIDCVNQNIGNGNFIIVVFVEWIENDTKIMSIYDLKYITSIPKFNEQFLIKLRESAGIERFLILNLVRGIQYTDVVIDKLTTSCVQRSEKINGQRTITQKVNEFDIDYEERYKLSDKTVPYVLKLTNNIHLPKVLVCLVLLKSVFMTKNSQPKLFDYIWLCDNHAITMFNTDPVKQDEQLNDEVLNEEAEDNFDDATTIPDIVEDINDNLSDDEKTIKEDSLQPQIMQDDELEDVIPRRDDTVIEQPKRKRGRPRKIIRTDEEVLEGGLHKSWTYEKSSIEPSFDDNF